MDLKFVCSVSKERLSTPRGAEEAAFLPHILKDLKLKLFPFLFIPTGSGEQEKKGIGEKEEKERHQKKAH